MPLLRSFTIIAPSAGVRILAVFLGTIVGVDTVIGFVNGDLRVNQLFLELLPETLDAGPPTCLTGFRVVSGITLDVGGCPAYAFNAAFPFFAGTPMAAA